MKLSSIDISPPGGFKGFGYYGLETTTPNNAAIIFGGFISRIIGVITIVAFIWFLFVFITGAISIIGAGSDKQAMETAKKKITAGLIGLVVTVAAIFVVRLIGSFLGIENFLSPAKLIEQITK